MPLVIPIFDFHRLNPKGTGHLNCGGLPAQSATTSVSGEGSLKSERYGGGLH